MQQLYDVPGVVLGVLQDGEAKAAGFGLTSLEHPLEVTDETLFQIGSISKTFSGTLLMKMAEEGTIDIDATVRTYVTDFKVADAEASEKVTIRHLLTHTCGWAGDYFLDTGAGDDAAAKYVSRMTDLEQLAPIGEVWSYNNAGSQLLGHVIEVAGGKSFQELLRERVLEPLSLENSYFDAGDVITHRFAVGHVNGRVGRPWPLSGREFSTAAFSPTLYPGVGGRRSARGARWPRKILPVGSHPQRRWFNWLGKGRSYP